MHLNCSCSWFSKQPGDAGMMSRYNKSRQAFSLGFAIWLVFLSVSVNVLHEHPGVRCDEIGSGGLARDEQGDIPPFGSAFLSEIREQDHPGTRAHGLCPVCLFLAKHIAVSADAPPGPTPKDTERGFATCGPSILVTSLDRPSAAPRAPPC